MLDQLVGLAMLVAASVVFLYYTIWTLLMVRTGLTSSASNHEANILDLAICRLGSCPTEPVPSTSLGNQNSRYPHTIGLCCCGIVFERGNDSKQQEAGCEGQSCYEEKGVEG
ncbi:Dolichol phosphate-mannose biosynthesis regulatory protein [Clarireedia jacksonii]